jgi:hypothetical protein
MSQVGNDGEGGKRTIDGTAELGSSNIVNQQPSVESGLIMKDWHRPSLPDRTPNCNLNASMPTLVNLGSAGA